MKNIKKFLQQIKVCDCPGLTKKRIGGSNDGGYVVSHSQCQKTKTVYGFGVGYDMNFEIKLQSVYNIEEIFLYDPTIGDINIKDRRFKFFSEGIGNGYGEFPEIKQDSFVKIDVEWDEWNALERISDSNISKISQLVLEIHIIHADQGTTHTPYFRHVYKRGLDVINDNLFGQYAQVMKKLNEHFIIFHIHANNSLPPITIGNYTFPPLLELSMIRKDLLTNGAKTTEQRFPIDGLDKPNKTDRADIHGWYPLGV